MTLEELAAAVHPGLSWDEVTRLMGIAWAVASKQHKADPMKLYYAWETIMSIYWEKYNPVEFENEVIITKWGDPVLVN